MAKKDTTKQAVALIELRHLSAPAGAILQGSPEAIAALVGAGAADDEKAAIAYAKSQQRAVVAMADEAPADGILTVASGDSESPGVTAAP